MAGPRLYARACGAAALPPTAPRVLIFQLSDDWGWANFGLHGSTNYTPNLDALAREVRRCRLAARGRPSAALPPPPPPRSARARGRRA